MTLIALTGMPAAGKGEVAAVAQQRGWAVHRIGDLVWEETERRGLELAPASVGAVANGEREAHGYGVWASRSLERIDALRAAGSHVLIDGMRGERELAVFRTAYGDALVTVAVVASAEQRLARVQQRGRIDDGDAAAFHARDERELGWSLAETIAAADETLANEGELDALRAAAGELLARLESL
ncbi:MAG: hypothetical protein BEU05_02560 [Marine Group III euryarchaeote CG-Bathy2]|uniref:Dephospho-CoA kinase n=1 Tax=Marine Group III euryarchaeote CG-Bathy2 TaxID=1889002 RepID=A0A1J5T007_9ARCH|nr:MAG: hypothetical protein BEU05_02560 [Marine Group III euryarchaeote CG-Bathy2]